ncbi:MAG: hypothetical protein IPP46_06685 [Bacteroidetes bacterium]|nr:hypothetical protein [Bacteroidota bacterium]
MGDSTVQVISYWDKGEKQIYALSLEKIKIKGSDTTSKEMTTYEVEITVLDSNEKSYTIQWEYKNFTSHNNSPVIQKLMNATQNMKVIFKTNELGEFVEVVNWKEIKDYTHKAMGSLRTEFKDIPEMDKLIKQMEATYSTKEAIGTASIKDIHQFHTFHGAQYKLGEVLNGIIKVPNILGTDPLDSDFSVYLDEINEEENNFILRATQEVNNEQLTNATFNYLTTMAKSMKLDPPKREDLGELKNETISASNIHTSGWVLYSIQTTTITSDNQTNIEERIIELK